jgi:hypothetical protein
MAAEMVALERRGINGFEAGYADLREPMHVVGSWEAWLVKVEPRYQVRDLFALLARMSPKALATLEELANWSIKPFLVEWKRSRIVPRATLAAVEVRKNIEIKRNGGDASEVSEITECLGRLRRPKPPRGARGKDTHVALGFTKWAALNDLPLRIAKRGVLRELVWRGSTLRTMRDKPCSFDLTLGEFLGAIFRELCFFGSPAGREQHVEELTRRIEEVRSGHVDAISAEDLLKRLRKRRSRRGRRMK